VRGERLIKNAPAAGVASCDLERAIARQDNAGRYRQARCGGARRHLTEVRRRSVMRRPPRTSTSDRKALGKSECPADVTDGSLGSTPRNMRMIAPC
jgi:hypothetical protein